MCSKKLYCILFYLHVSAGNTQVTVWVGGGSVATATLCNPCWETVSTGLMAEYHVGFGGFWGDISLNVSYYEKKKLLQQIKSEIDVQWLHNVNNNVYLKSKYITITMKFE